ncbi:hypothetical protein BDR05DRAFT_997962 [Suillus weaverae]|nr:hypothetical protein BDR05DRAFT_997962 [Suillus weaverae]
MSSKNPPTQGVRNAKKKAMDNAVWLPENTRTKRQKSDTGSQKSKPKSTKRRRHDSPAVALEDEENNHWSLDTDSQNDEPQWGSQPRSKAKAIKRRHRDLTPVPETDSDGERVATKRKKSSQVNKKSHRTAPLSQRSIKDGHSEKSESRSEAEDYKDSDLTDLVSSDSDMDTKSVANKLSTEIPSFVSSGSKAKKPLVNAQSARACK